MPISLDGTGSISGISTFSFSDEIIHTGDTNTAIKFPANDTVALDTSGSERIRIDSTGRVLIGTTNADSVGSIDQNVVIGSTTNAEEVALTLNVMEGTNNRRIKLFLDDDDGVFGLDSTASTGVPPFVVRMATSEKLRIDSSGRLIVGSGSHGGGAQVVIKGGGVNTYSTLGMYSNHTNPTSGTLLSQIRFGSNATADGADIRVHADADWGTNDYPSRIGFYTAPDGSNSRHEGLRIDSAGRIFTGNDTTLCNSERGSLHVSGGGTAGSRISIRGTATGAGNGLAEVFAFWDTNKVAGMIAFAGEDTTNKDDGKLSFYTADGAGVQARMKISKEGYVTKPNIPTFSAVGSNDAISAQSPLPYDSVEYNNGNHYSNSTFKFTCPITGYYYITCHVVPKNYSTGGNNVELYIKDQSGNRYFLDRKVKSNNYSTNNFSVGGSRILYKSAGNTLWVEFNAISGSPLLEGSSHFGITLMA